MSFQATVYKILIASPGDVSDEREKIAEVISSWNNLHSESKQVVLLPVRWETHSSPMLGDRPQAIINNQIVNSCDMLIGTFWTRLGTPTGYSQSGTVEEIEYFLKNKKPIMLYFSNKPIKPDDINIEQYKALEDFKTKVKELGLVSSYSDLSDLKEQLSSQLFINIENLINERPVELITKKERQEQIKMIENMIKQNEIYIQEYEKDGQIKSFLVKGETKPIGPKLKEKGGIWNRTLQGWIFPIEKKMEITKFIKEIP